MDRWACIDLPAFPLQLLLRQHPEWNDLPVVVVDKDAPQGRTLWANEAARRLTILPGMRYAAALSLCSDLRAGTVDVHTIAAATAQVVTLLRDFSPDVEPCAEEPGVFWVDASGLAHLFASASAWGEQLHAALTQQRFVARVVVGFTRYGSYAVAKGLRHAQPVRVFRQPSDEQETARNVPLNRLEIDPELRDDLDKLGVHTLGRFLELPASELNERFGEPVALLHRLANGAAWQPLQPQEPLEPLEGWLELETAENDITRLLFLVKELLDPLLARLVARGEAAAAVSLALLLDPSGRRDETVRAAEPTSDAALLLDLIRLRLTPQLSGHNATRIEAVGLTVLAARTAARQATLPEGQATRDLAAANRALARVRAELGAAAVARARLREGHLPEASFLWEPLDALPAKTHPRAGPATLIRRIFPRPHALPPRVQHLRDDGWLLSGVDHGPVEKLEGPYVIAGGWWAKPIHREYHFAQTQRGDLLWVYYDRPKRRWFLQGDVQ